MGRLMLHVLLSFAQFEREVGAERVRDKIASSKAKGMWMGGTIPLGYDVADCKLVVNEAEAETVRAIFAAFSTSAVRGPKLVSGSLLQGLIVDRHGRTMGPVHTTRNGQRFRYYVTHPRTIREGDPAPYRLAADAIERICCELLASHAAAQVSSIDGAADTKRLTDDLNHGEHRQRRHRR